MGVKLNDLYNEICSDYQVKLLTSSFFDKEIDWVHILEDKEFASFLHGGELIFNSGLNFEEEDEITNFVKALLEAKAGGLIVAMEQASTFPASVIKYCNQANFPVLWCAWDTSYREVMQCFSEFLLSQERNATNLVAVLKNAIFSPQDEERYVRHFERNGFLRTMDYTVVIVGYKKGQSKTNKSSLDKFEKSLRFLVEKHVYYEENDRLIILTTGYTPMALNETFTSALNRYPSLQMGVGSLVTALSEIHNSYQQALSALQLVPIVTTDAVLNYDDMGIYQILIDVNHKEVCTQFLQKTLGDIITHDKTHGTEYLHILQVFFDHDCNLANTADALYCHKNTLYHKMNAIKELLGYDILKNENRFQLMLAFHILKLKEIN